MNNSELVAQVLNAICDAQPFTTRYYVKNLRTGDVLTRRADEEGPSASTRKTSIMMAALKAIHDGKLNPDEKIVYEQRYAEEVASGIFRYFTPGIEITLRDAITGMMVLSDNVCTKMVLERLSLDAVRAYCAAIGLKNTNHRFLIPPINLAPDHKLGDVTTTSPADQALLLELILEAQTSEAAAQRLQCSQELCAFALKTLKSQILRYGIRSRLPYNAIVANKSGTGKRGRMDAGIVYYEGEPLYVISVYTDHVPLEMPDGTPGYTLSLETIGRLSRACWDGFRA